ncbi:MAG: DUF1801 domain-containing protein [Dehalococcoidia bacterium]|nr:DUF1801 domain-containing protein [Dehalococcoidia bacterium]MSQ16127.1 DUF1801 domain-containing protein [Dehalococcoidia bacterium]
MVKSAATTPEAYLSALPQERQQTIAALRQIVLDNLPARYAEAMRWGGLCYEVTLERYPKTYNKQPLMYAALASQKNYCSLYLTAVYMEQSAEAWLRAEFARADKKLNMGKSCVRFKKLDDLPLDAIGRAIASTSVDAFLTVYERSRRRQG